MMKILKKAKTPDETVIQLENWREDYTYKKTLNIAAYPIAKNSSENKMIKANEIFRLNLTGFTSDKEALDIFRKLENGEITLSDLKEHFYNKDCAFYLGIN